MGDSNSFGDQLATFRYGEINEVIFFVMGSTLEKVPTMNVSLFAMDILDIITDSA